MYSCVRFAHTGCLQYASWMVFVVHCAHIISLAHVLTDASHLCVASVVVDDCSLKHDKLIKMPDIPTDNEYSS